MLNYLVDVPVKINIWIRPEFQKKQFEVIKKARPSVLFIVSDGGRNDSEWEIINTNRHYVESNIDWDCKVHKVYQNKNVGMYGIGEVAHNYIWNFVDRCIFFEDDNIPSVSYFKFCEELLEKYKDDLRIECICAMNHLEKYEETDSDYFFSRQGSIWGYATWKRTWLERKELIDSISLYSLTLIDEQIKYNKQIFNRIKAYNKQLCYEGHVPGDEFWIDYHIYSQNRLQIIPKYNLISNIGDDKNSEHFKKTQLFMRKILNMKSYDIDFPLKHPNFVIADENYERLRNKRMGVNRSILKKAFDHIIVGDFEIFKKKLSEIFSSYKQSEK